MSHDKIKRSSYSDILYLFIPNDALFAKGK